MASEKQRSAARRNIRKAATAAKKKRTIAQRLFLSLRSKPLTITARFDISLHLLQRSSARGRPRCFIYAAAYRRGIID